MRSAALFFKRFVLLCLVLRVCIFVCLSLVLSLLAVFLVFSLFLFLLSLSSRLSLLSHSSAMEVLRSSVGKKQDAARVQAQSVALDTDTCTRAKESSGGALCVCWVGCMCVCGGVIGGRENDV